MQIPNKLRMFALLAATGSVSCLSSFAYANNNPPPAGAILDLNGTLVNHGTAVEESVNFAAGVASTNITFAFREDPAFISFSNVSLVDDTTPAGNLILNGDFSSGTGNNATDWTFANIYGADASGVVSSSCGGGLTTCWFDGSVQAYDAITQVVMLNVGDTYTLSYFYSDNGPLTTFSDLSTNGDTTDTGGNGIGIDAYAQAGLPAAGGAAPEPSSFALLGTGILGAAAMVRRRLS